MSNNQGASANTSHGQVNPPYANTNTGGQDDQTIGLENLNFEPHNSSASQGQDLASAEGEPVPPKADNTDLLIRNPDTLHREARLVKLMFDIHSAVPPKAESRLGAIEARLRQLTLGETEDIKLMNVNELQTEGLRLLTMIDGNEETQAVSNEDVSAITHRLDAVNARLVELRLLQIRPDIQAMSILELDEEQVSLWEEFHTMGIAENMDPLKIEKDIADIRKRFRDVLQRQAELMRFPSDNNEDTLEEDQIQHRLHSSGNLPRFLFRGSNSRSGGNKSESEPSSLYGERSDAGDDEVESHHAARMINEAGRIVPHAHLADPTLLDHPRRQTFNSLLQAADHHTSARQFNTPFTSWSFDYETALYFAIGHYPSLNEFHIREEAGEQTDWVFHEPDVPAFITVLDTWTIPERHLRVFHHPDLLLDPNEEAIPSEFLIYGALDRADGVDLRGVSIQELSIRLHCPTWPLCASRIKLPHQPDLQDVSEAWTIARAFFMQDGNGGGEDMEESNVGDDIRLAVLAGELARHQWAGSPPRPDAQEFEAQTQIQWPEAWLRRIRRLLARIFGPGLEPIDARVAVIALANASTPDVGFPQFHLMQQLLLSWVGDESADVIGGDEGHDGEETHVAPLRHDCANPNLRDTLSELELAIFWSQMVQRDRQGNAPTLPPRENASTRNNSAVLTIEEPTSDVVPVEEVAEEQTVEEEEPLQEESIVEEAVEEDANNDADVENASVEDAPAVNLATDEMPTEANDANNEAPGLEPEQQPAAPQKYNASAQRVLPEKPEIADQDPPQEPRGQLSLQRGSGYQAWIVEEMPFTFFRFLVFVVMCLLTVGYFTLALAVYEIGEA